MGILPREFYCRDTLIVAPDLLGKYLIREEEGEKLVLRITEVEAYIGRMDKACHAYGYKRTARTKTLFAAPGTAYLYLIYGMYTCLNFVTEPEGEPCAVLIRAGEAVWGAERMAQNRFSRPLAQLTAYQRKNFLNGPGKVCKALRLTRAENGMDLTAGGMLYAVDALPGQKARPVPAETIQTGRRIGIDYAEEAAAFPWRFWIDP